MKSASPEQNGEKAASPPALAPGLYLVGTPIGNLEDITLRALRVLKQADLIACEDTRHTQKLLNHYGIAARTISYHEHNEAARAKELVARIQSGESVALVTDAGTPGISDPGFRVVSAAVAAGITVVPVPGASAFLTAIVASGLPVDAICFDGFLPSKRGERRSKLEAIKRSPETHAFYEAPHRILETIVDIVETLGAFRPIVIAREITKIHEEFLRGPAGELQNLLKSRATIKGEITLLIGKSCDPEPKSSQSTISQRVAELMATEELDEKSALKKAAKERGLSKSEAYREWQRSK